MRTPLPAAKAATLLALVCGAVGCDQGHHEAMVAARREIVDLRETNNELQRERMQLRAEVRQQNQQIKELQSLGTGRLERLFTVRRIELGNTSAVSTDDDEAHDAVKVYLLPTDSHGSTIKAAGEVTIRLYDLQRDKPLLREFTFSPEKLAEHWSGGFGVYHFSFVCPWGDTTPTGGKVTVHVTFQDLLTGKAFTAQKVVNVSL